MNLDEIKLRWRHPIWKAAQPRIVRVFFWKFVGFREVFGSSRVMLQTLQHLQADIEALIGAVENSAAVPKTVWHDPAKLRPPGLVEVIGWWHGARHTTEPFRIVYWSTEGWKLANGLRICAPTRWTPIPAFSLPDDLPPPASGVRAP